MNYSSRGGQHAKAVPTRRQFLAPGLREAEALGPTRYPHAVSVVQPCPFCCCLFACFGRSDGISAVLLQGAEDVKSAKNSCLSAACPWFPVQRAVTQDVLILDRI